MTGFNLGFALGAPVEDRVKQELRDRAQVEGQPGGLVPSQMWIWASEGAVGRVYVQVWDRVRLCTGEWVRGQVRVGNRVWEVWR